MARCTSLTANTYAAAPVSLGSPWPPCPGSEPLRGLSRDDRSPRERAPMALLLASWARVWTPMRHLRVPSESCKLFLRLGPSLRRGLRRGGMEFSGRLRAGRTRGGRGRPGSALHVNSRRRFEGPLLCGLRRLLLFLQHVVTKSCSRISARGAKVPIHRFVVIGRRIKCRVIFRRLATLARFGIPH